ncbi:MAG TPA: guanylate kinase [Lacipirellulaceae bacterium]|nr:guanylate kinase [Lacipirellulaceae bacterium]
MTKVDDIPPSAFPLSPSHLIVLSGPSGVGKSTVLRSLLSRYPDRLRLSVSATTRPPRRGEVEGVDYYFLTPEEFARRREVGEFLESCEVFGRGHWYGTLLDEVRPSPGDQKWVILDIDVDGAEKVLSRFPDVPTIFLRPSSDAELERRLRARGTESEEAIQRRLEVARRELARADQYRFQVVNDTVEQAVGEISHILEQLDVVGSSERPTSNVQHHTSNPK